MMKLERAADSKLNRYLHSIDKQFDADDIERARQDRIDEQLQDNRLAREAEEAFGDLNGVSDIGMRKIYNALMQGLLLNNSKYKDDYREVTVGQLLNHLSDEEKEFLKMKFLLSSIN